MAAPCAAETAAVLQQCGCKSFSMLKLKVIYVRAKAGMGGEDPNNKMQSWDPTLFNPCTWFHMTCNDDKYVIWTCDKQLKKFMNLEIYFQN